MGYNIVSIYAGRLERAVTYFFGHVVLLVVLAVLGDDGLGEDEVVVEQQRVRVDPPHALGSHALQVALQDELSPEVV
jgi:hypothetical protein